EMPESADAVHGNDLSGACTRMAQRVVDRDARTHKGTRFRGRQCLGNRREGFRPCNHVFGVSAVEVEARDLALHAHGEVPAPALVADETMSPMPADAHTLPWPPRSNVVAHRIDVSCDFMTWHTWILQPGQRPSLTNTSLWHIPHTSTFTRTCP